MSHFLRRLGACMASSNRWSKVHGSRPSTGWPFPIKRLPFPSQMLHHSSGNGPKASIWFAVTSSISGRKTSRNDLTPTISQMMQPRLQMSDEYDNGVAGSKRVSGGRVLRGVNDCSRVSWAGEKAVPKSVSVSLASERVKSSACFPNQAGV